MKSLRDLVSPLLILGLSAALASACGGGEEPNDSSDGGDGDGDDRPMDGDTGAVCEVADDCFPDVAEGELAGEAICLDRVDDGYCTHECEMDEDCCAAEGECEGDFSQVCAPFESTGTMMCFLSCEQEDLDAAGVDDDGVYCQENVSYDFICRSSGGGSANRKICVPGDCDVGEACDEDADCAAGLSCNSDYRGGYCMESGCEADADCPDGSVCVDDGGEENVCLKTCEGESDCSFCRDAEVATACDADVTSVDGSDVSVCLPERL